MKVKFKLLPILYCEECSHYQQGSNPTVHTPIPENCRLDDGLEIECVGACTAYPPYQSPSTPFDVGTR